MKSQLWIIKKETLGNVQVLWVWSVYFLVYLAAGYFIWLVENARLWFGLCSIFIHIIVSAVFQTAERMNKAEIKCSDSSQHISVIGEVTVNSLGG